MAQSIKAGTKVRTPKGRVGIVVHCYPGAYDERLAFVRWSDTGTKTGGHRLADLEVVAARDEDYSTWAEAHVYNNHAARPGGAFGCPFCGSNARPLPNNNPWSVRVIEVYATDPRDAERTALEMVAHEPEWAGLEAAYAYNAADTGKLSTPDNLGRLIYAVKVDVRPTR